MKKTLYLFFFLALIPLCSSVQALNLSKTSSHYAQEMEYYYAKKRPEIVPAMFATFCRESIFASGEKRMLVAAFLAMLARNGDVRLERLLGSASDKNARLTLAWAAWFGGNNALNAKLLTELPDYAGKQMRRMPQDLSKWDPAQEKSTVSMFWAAYFASGSVKWIDRLIDAAITHAHGSKGGSMVAASLYVYAPRHEAVRQQLITRLAKLKGSEAETIAKILQQDKTSGRQSTTR